ncbi:MAG TPA: hypothetical protein VK327_07330, partial [Candidatus Paceibacterota bacterium]|nr:hypothetical protein [Candidatus Paceibacterota bacterium]
IAQGGLRLDFDTVFAATYQLQTTTNLASGTWKEAGASVIGNGEPAFLVLPEPTDPRTFYRLRAQ